MNKMYNKILIPLDGSGAAEIVLPYAAEIAAKLDSEITLVSISESSATDIDHLYRSYLEHLTGQVRNQLKEYGAKEGLEVKSEVLLGIPSDEIARCATEYDVGLIAMASSGRPGHGPLLLGNITPKIIRSTDRPLLLIRVSASSEALQQKRLVKKILIPLDGSKVGETAIRHTEALAKALGAELVLIQIIEPVVAWAGFEGTMSYAAPQDEESMKSAAIAYLSGVAKPLKESGLSTSIAIGFGSSADQIIDYAEANNIDLIAISSHGRSGIGRWLFGSVTSKLLRAADTPVLVVRATKA
jgi:nucleotide-binding universal stress UspA family protein